MADLLAEEDKPIQFQREKVGLHVHSFTPEVVLFVCFLVFASHRFPFRLGQVLSDAEVEAVLDRDTDMTHGSFSTFKVVKVEGPGTSAGGRA